MIKVNSEANQVCVAKANEAGQGHIFDAWDDLSSEEQKRLIEQVEQVDFQLVKRLIQQHRHSSREGLEGRVLKPAPATRLPRPEFQKEEFELCRTLGEYALRSQEVALIMAAGGEAPGPLEKSVGMLPVGPVTGKSSFQLHAEKILALNRRYRTSLRCQIFCRPAERQDVAAFFRANGFFGLKCSDLQFISQELLPVIDRRGKILLSNPGQLAMSPNGHGGILLQLVREEELEMLQAAGIKHLFYFPVDNPLVHIADPLFLGLHIKNEAEVSSKCVVKTDPEERVGVFCQINGALGVVEYTELGREDREERLLNGSLAFSAANTGIHVFSVDFLRRLSLENFQLPFHAVERLTPYLDKRGRIVRPASPNSFKFTAFVFDAIPAATRATLVEVERQEEFSPIKNLTGPNSPQTARRDLSSAYGRWLEQACPGWRPRPGPEGEPAVEISPLFALDLDELKEKSDLPLPAKGDVLLGGRA